MAFSKRQILPLLIVMGLAVPQGVSNIFLPSLRVSSIYDPSDVNLPIISFQCLLVIFYCIAFGEKIRITAYQIAYIILFFGLCFVCALFSVSPLGYISYSTLWFVMPFAILIHFLNVGARYTGYNFISDIRLVAILFIPFYVFDFIASAMFGGVIEFSSFTLASNGHSFVSFLFALVFFIYRSPGFEMSKKNGVFDILFFCVYIFGGAASGGRMALISFVVCIFILAPRKSLLYIALISPLVFFLLSASEKYALIFDVVRGGDLDDIRIWSSGISRLNFWTTYLDIFYSNWISGAGGLAGNLIKYDYGFPYGVFVDPHNEFIFLLSGFGISGVAFAFASASLTYSMARNARHGVIGKLNGFHAAKSVWVVNIYVFICSLTNANSAKQNIQVLLVFVLLASILTLIGSVKRSCSSGATQAALVECV